ncbi:MAG: hypothetical protein F4Z40_08030 [Chloroflexi bacterium]|nr:hypothetical protein [Chloroflexota bacterium]
MTEHQFPDDLGWCYTTVRDLEISAYRRLAHEQPDLLGDDAPNWMTDYDDPTANKEYDEIFRARLRQNRDLNISNLMLLFGEPGITPAQRYALKKVIMLIDQLPDVIGTN